MIVLLDLEWIEKDRKHLTQLSAIRTYEDWNVSSNLELYAKPCPACLREQKHIAYGGLSIDLYKNGSTEEDCIHLFKKWLIPDDIIWVWAKSNQQYLIDLWHRYLASEIPPRIYSMTNEIRKRTSQTTRDVASPYTMLKKLNITPPSPEHLALNDIEAMRLLFDNIGISMTQLETVPPKVPPPKLTQKERNQRTINKSQYNYVYLKQSEVFHRRECKLCLNAKSEGNILGSIYYETAAKGRRPCKACNPVPLLFTAPITDKDLSYIERKRTGALSKLNNEVIRARMLDGSVTNIKRGKIIGWCHHYLHEGAITKTILSEHDCLNKNCPYLERNCQSPFWAELELKKESKEKRKAKIKAEKMQRAIETSELNNLAAIWQSYLDDMDSDMLIVLVTKESPNRYKIFYVSENRFADGNRYPLFLDTLKEVHTNYRITLRHIRDVDGHFVTREEYSRCCKVS